jgi:hypothetical protein
VQCAASLRLGMLAPVQAQAQAHLEIPLVLPPASKAAAHLSCACGLHVVEVVVVDAATPGTSAMMYLGQSLHSGYCSYVVATVDTSVRCAAFFCFRLTPSSVEFMLWRCPGARMVRTG